jgi:hypothetical protein
MKNLLLKGFVQTPLLNQPTNGKRTSMVIPSCRYAQFIMGCWDAHDSPGQNTSDARQLMFVG